VGTIAHVWAASGLFLQSSDRYASLFLIDRTDYKSWARSLQQCGYATSNTYGKKLVAVIEKYQLHELDKFTEDVLR
jgi:flagellum-specific peptidoglycan hydrolase FlgJ